MSARESARGTARSGSAKKKTVLVIYYSLYGHVEALARAECRGLEKVGINPKLYQIAESLPQEILDKMKAPPKASDVPVITAADMKNADGFLFGIPTRFGMVPAQMKAFFDSCGQLWMSGALANKFVGVFFSTSAQGSGQETTAMSTMPFFAHMGLIYVPVGGKIKYEGDKTIARGGSAWGAGTIAQNNDQPLKIELDAAEQQGADFGTICRRTNFDL